MKIENEFVDYNTALALKKLGFDEPCLAYYENNDLTHGMLNDIGKRRYLQTPLYQQAFRWFREKYNLWNMIYPRDGWNYTIQEIDNMPSVFGNSYHKTEMKTYEDAELECLKKLIEIINENNYRKIN